MKRRKVSPFSLGVPLFLLIFFLIGITIFSWLLTIYQPADAAHPYDLGFVGATSPIIACSVGLCLSLRMLLKGACTASYTVDADGMMTYWHKKIYRLLWEDCVEFEIIPIMINHGTAIYVVYCSTRMLSQKEKENFFSYHKNDFAHIQYFQYGDEEAFREFLSCIPESARNYMESRYL